MKTVSFTPGVDRATKRWVVLAVVSTVVTLLLETRWGLHLRFPGHRALPGAFALLVVAEAAPAWMLLAYSVAMPLLVIGLGRGDAVLVVPWLGLALLLVAVRTARWRRSLAFLVLAGLAYGVLRFGVLLVGPHKTPQLVRAGGHLLFGGLGGLLAALASKTDRTRKNDHL
jgi:hypothetical protein